MANGYKIFFCADLHHRHKNILKFQKNRLEKMGIDESLTDTEKLEKHDEWLIKMWNFTVGKHDHVYILGDVSFGSTEETRKFIEKLHGKKHLIIGNHDKSCQGIENYFESVSQIKEFPIKKDQYDFLEENIYLVLCHFPMVAWNRRLNGALHLHGHTHGSINNMNLDSGELRVDIGLDSDIANCGLVDLETVYRFMKNKIAEKGFTDFKDYVENKANEDGIRY